MKGRVYLVGAGPGDPGSSRCGASAISRGRRRRLRRPREPPDCCARTRGAERVDVGNARAPDRTREQDEINALLVARARAGRPWCVSRAAIRSSSGAAARRRGAAPRRGSRFEIVPGVTSALARSGLRGHPGHGPRRTRRRSRSSPGTRRRRGRDVAAASGKRSRTRADTLVVLMGMTQPRARSARLLVARARAGDAAAAVIDGSTPRQRVVRRRSRRCRRACARRASTAPRWWSSATWCGCATRSLVRVAPAVRTARAGHARDAASRRPACCPRSRRADAPVVCPLIEIAPPSRRRASTPRSRGSSATTRSSSPRANGVRALCDALGRSADVRGDRGRSPLRSVPRPPRSSRAAPASRRTTCPTRSDAEGLPKPRERPRLRGKRFLLPCAQSRAILPARLRARARASTRCWLRAAPAPSTRAARAERVARGALDALTFTARAVTALRRAARPMRAGRDAPAIRWSRASARHRRGGPRASGCGSTSCRARTRRRARRGARASARAAARGRARGTLDDVSDGAPAPAAPHRGAARWSARRGSLADQLVLPLFVVPGPRACAKPVAVDARRRPALGRPRRRGSRRPRPRASRRCILFGIPEQKDAAGSRRLARRRHRAARGRRAIKAPCPSSCVITDVCLLRVHRPRPLRRPARRRGRERPDARAARRGGRRARARRRRRRRAVGHDGRRGSAAIRERARRRRASTRGRSWPTPPSTRRRSTVRSATPRSRRRSSATAAATRWTRPTRARRCARSRSTSRRAPTSSW